MIIHHSDSRGFADHGWLKSRHTFSFADYYNPERMGFGTLRVINDDRVEATYGFGKHGHRDMEIISIPLSGELKHEDSEGNSGVIKKGEIQIMSAGTGIVHSEFNPSETEAVNFLQIWVLPKEQGIKPRYQQKTFPHDERLGKIQTIISPDGRDGSLVINQDAYFSLCDLKQGEKVSYKKHSPKCGVYLFVIEGEVELLGKTFKLRDGVGITDLEGLDIESHKDSEILLIEVPI
jgi:redox-sensitive bicupin YhaK (pirin superfamily)